MIMEHTFCWVITFGLLIIVALCKGQSYVNENCAPFPNFLPTPNTYNVGQMLTAGPWYGYLIYNSDAPSAKTTPDVNVASYYTSLGKVPESTRNQLAEVIIQEKRRYLNGSCASTLIVSHFTTDGRQFGPAFAGIGAQGVIGHEGYDASTIWSTDQSTYIMYLWCLKYNWQTGACARTRIYVYTRTKPTDMTSSQKQTINGAVDAVLQPYCLNSSQFAQYQFDNYLPECPVAPRPDCFTHVVNAYMTILSDQL